MKEKIVELLIDVIGRDASAVDVFVPERENLGHYSTNVAMRLAKVRGKNPVALAEELAAGVAKKAPAGFFEKVEAAKPGFINFWLSKKAIQNGLEEVSREKVFGKSSVGKGKTVIVEYSQPNIAKMMHVGHLRTTVIGDALANILDSLGYRVVRWNYLGDWGTQFGKLIAAYKTWPLSASDIKERPIKTLQDLYVRFHDEAKVNPELEKRGQEEFKKLEDGDPENRKLWEWFKAESLKEFEAAYKTLDVRFDEWIGESFFEGEMKPLVKELVDKNIAERSEGSLIIKLDKFHLPPALVEKSDGASLYLTRDIANLRYRLEKYKPAKILYVVGNEQSLYFEQLFSVAEILGIASADSPLELKHIKYGLVLGEAGKKLATREGRTILLKDVVLKAVSLARKIVEEKNKDLSPGEKDEVAQAVGIGALKYNDLKENRTTDIVFDWEKMLDFSGDSGPYIQYTYARLMSILRKAGEASGHDLARLDGENELALIRKIFELPDVVEKAGELYSTSLIAGYLHKLAVAANKFYETTPILKDEDVGRRNARLILVGVAANNLKIGLGLLGVNAIDRI